MQRTAVFNDAQMAGGDLVGHPVIEHDDAVGNIFLQPVPGEGFAPAFGRDDGGDSLVLEPAEEPPQFGAQDGLVRQAGEQCFEGIQHHALGPDGIDRVIEPDKQALQVIVAAFLNLTGLDVDIVDQDFFAPDQAGQVETKRGDIGRQFLFRFLERHEYARFVEPHSAAHEKFRGQQCLAAARAATDQSGAPAWQTAIGNFIEALDTGRTLGQTCRRGPGFGAFGFHLRESVDHLCKYDT